MLTCHHLAIDQLLSIMVSRTVVLFLFGAAMASGQFMPKLHPVQYENAMKPGSRFYGCPSGPELAPLICQFMQPNMELKFKPQLITPSTYIPPLVVKECDKVDMEFELPSLIEEHKSIIIPEAPVLPPITLPKLPIPVKVEKPILTPVSIVESYEPAFISEMDIASVSAAPELPPREILAFPVQPENWLTEKVESEIDYKPMVIPQPPELQPFVMPEQPFHVRRPQGFAPCPEEERIDIVHGYVHPLGPMPAAPELPPARLPEIPVRIEFPSQPIMPPMDFLPPSLILKEPCITGEPIMVPQLFQLLDRVKVAKPLPMPSLPAYPEPALIADPCEPSLPIIKIGELPPFFGRHFPDHRSIAHIGHPSPPHMRRLY